LRTRSTISSSVIFSDVVFPNLKNAILLIVPYEKGQYFSKHGEFKISL
jgi:hypothetical protein